MPLPEDKKSWLKTMGVSDAALEGIDNTLKSLATTAQSAGIESKEQSDAASEEAVAEQAKMTDAVAETDVKAAMDSDGEMEEGKKTPKRGKKKEAAALINFVDAHDISAPAPPSSDYATKEEVAGAVTETVLPMIEAIKALSTQVATLTKEVAALKQSDEEKLAATKELTPSLSISDIIAQNIIGKESTVVDGRSSLGKDRPAEKEAPAPPSATPVPFLNGLMHAAQGK